MLGDNHVSVIATIDGDRALHNKHNSSSLLYNLLILVSKMLGMATLKLTVFVTWFCPSHCELLSTVTAAEDVAGLLLTAAATATVIGSDAVADDDGMNVVAVGRRLVSTVFNELAPDTDDGV